MRIYVNGEPCEVEDGLSLERLIALRQLTGQRVAIEIDEELIPRSGHALRTLRPDERVEIVSAIGGG